MLSFSWSTAQVSTHGLASKNVFHQEQNRNFHPTARVDQAVGLYYRKENLTF